MECVAFKCVLNLKRSDFADKSNIVCCFVYGYDKMNVCEVFEIRMV